MEKLANLKNSYTKILAVAVCAFAVAGLCTTPVLAQNPVAVADSVVQLAFTISNGIRNIINDDNKKREAFTQGYVDAALRNYPNYNVVISHNGGQITGNGAIHKHVELPMTVGTCGYEVYLFPRGQTFVFMRNGDGGYINWALGGNFTSNGGTVIFS